VPISIEHDIAWLLPMPNDSHPVFKWRAAVRLNISFVCYETLPWWEIVSYAWRVWSQPRRSWCQDPTRVCAPFPHAMHRVVVQGKADVPGMPP
jgi:hypothetical protein